MIATAPKIAGMPRPRKPIKMGRPLKDGDALITVSSGVEPQIAVVIDSLAKEAKRSRSQQIALIIEEWMRSRGLFPPPEPPPSK